MISLASIGKNTQISKSKEIYRIISRRLKTLRSEVNLTKEGECFILNCCSRDFIFNGKIRTNSIIYNLNYGMPHKECILEQNGIYIDGLQLLKKQAELSLKFWEIL